MRGCCRKRQQVTRCTALCARPGARAESVRACVIISESAVCVNNGSCLLPNVAWLLDYDYRRYGYDYDYRRYGYH
jgi:hypothetical protein